MAITTAANLPAMTEDDLETARQEYIKTSGRPSKFTPQLAAEICARLEKETITAICKSEHMPVVQTVNDWKRHMPVFATAFARARMHSAHVRVDLGYDAIDSLDVQKFDADGLPIKLSMTSIRLAEVKFKANMEGAKAYDRDQFGDSKRIEQRIQVEHTVGGIIERITNNISALVIECDDITDV